MLCSMDNELDDTRRNDPESLSMSTHVSREEGIGGLVGNIFQRSSDDAADSRQQTSHASRSYQDHSYRSRTPSENGGYFHHSCSKGLTLSVPSDAFHDGLSTCDPSPISPATPCSAVLARDQLAPYPMAKDHRWTSESYHTLTVPLLEWSSVHGPGGHEEIRDSEATSFSLPELWARSDMLASLGSAQIASLATALHSAAHMMFRYGRYGTLWLSMRDPEKNQDTQYYWDLSKHIFCYNHCADAASKNGLGNIHTVNELVDIDSFLEMIRFFIALILNADEVDNL
ncbi:hypothetical protein Hypma_003626 [Hypsizygus marmoreus]|uniref:Uncharacterized protein n=1 Tax=Hypsizygus marmoreus TaxID=39966 RepID=A0A369JAD3_HYPMA|nr:hypothetical protein Hypma_003626 [Hypsizygus marmoreus]